MMPGINYAIYGCSLREQLQKYHYTGALTLEKNIIAVITQGRVIDDNLESKLKTELCVLVDFTYRLLVNLNFSIY